MQSAWERKLKGERVTAGQHDEYVTLAMAFKWDYWTIDAQPVTFIQELTARLNAETEIVNQRQAEANAKAERERILNQLRANNQRNIRTLARRR